MSESTFTLRIDSKLKESFTEIAKLQDRTAAQLVREFMRDIVQKAEQKQEYDAWFARKVAEGRANVALGKFISNDDVAAEAEKRAQRLRMQMDDNQ